MPDQNNCECACPEILNVPVTGLTLPMCGFGVNIDASKLPKCECELASPAKQGLAPAGGQAGQIYGVNDAGDAYGWFDPAERYELCEFYYFRHPKPRPGFQPAHGGLLENAASLYPRAWEYLQSDEGRLLCLSEEEWQAMTRASWATLADGTEVGWEGVGGAPFYALHLDTGALRLPDLRGMYAEAAGFDGLEVGGVHGDAIRNIVGNGGNTMDPNSYQPLTGALYDRAEPLMHHLTNSGDYPWYGVAPMLDVSRVVPVANKNQPRAWGALACVYLGRQG